MSLTVSTRLDDPAPWMQPVRYGEQHQRFRAQLHELGSSVPDQDFPALLGAVVDADTQLESSLAAVAEGSAIETARAAVQPALDELAAAIGALEHESTNTVFGASLPSSRTTG